MAAPALLLVHSPLVGPSSLRRLSAAASATGARVALPDLTPLATAPHPHDEYVERAVAAARRLGSTPAIVGHSGAGVFLPAIGDEVSADATLLFVDAVLPPRAGVHTTSDDMTAMLDEQTRGGVLRPWLTWWPPEIVQAMLPSATDRREIEADSPSLPRSFYDVDIAVPPGWSERPCAYLRLSAAYDAELSEATSRHWPTASLDSTHLGVFTEPRRVLADVGTLVDRVARTDRRGGSGAPS